MLALSLLIAVSLVSSSIQTGFEDYRNHPCARQCSGPDYKGPMQCDYSFVVESYMTMSTACKDCPTNMNDCFNKGCVPADGVKRAIKTVNRMIPGPGLIVCEGDLLRINVTNHLNSFEATSIHWHGIRQQGTPHMDGISLITQCPITPNMQFQYSFHAKDPGTHFWHAHSSVHRSDGITGALVVRPLKDSNSRFYDHDLNEHVIVLTDWVHQLTIAKYTDFEHAEGGEDIDSILINGHGQTEMEEEQARMSKETHQSHVPRAVFNVDAGQRYRFRMIGAGSFYCPMMVSVEDHPLTVISTDGHNTQPLDVSSFIILNGERVDFVLNANKTSGCYWIKVKGLADCADSETFQTAVLKYGGSSCDQPDHQLTYNTSNPNVRGKTLNPFNELMGDEEFIPIDQIKLSNDSYETKFIQEIQKPVTHKFYVGLRMNEYSDELTQGTNFYQMVKAQRSGMASHEWPQLNNLTFKMPDTPYLFKEDSYFKENLCSDQSPSKLCEEEGFCSCAHAYQVNLNDLVEIVFVDEGFSDENHPMHLHGNYFAVLATKKVDEGLNIEDLKKMDAENKLPRNLENPPLKDTVTVPSGGYTIIRFPATNPGFWLLHCHVEFHSESGMMMAIRVGSKKDLPGVPAGWPQCNSFLGASQPDKPTQSASSRSPTAITILLALVLSKLSLF